MDTVICGNEEDLYNKIVFLTGRRNGFYIIDRKDGEGQCVCIKDPTIMQLITLDAIKSITKEQADSVVIQEVKVEDLLARIVALELKTVGF